MKKVYLPVYLIEWSDVRPYVYATGRGIKNAILWTWTQLSIYTPIVLHALARFSMFLLKLLRRIICLCAKGLVAFLRALWRMVMGIFTVSNPRADDEEYEEEEAEEPKPQLSAEEDKEVTRQRTIFDDVE